MNRYLTLIEVGVFSNEDEKTESRKTTMNINQLKYFISVAECRSFTQAAERHFLTQTAITLQIQKLEESMDVQLIDRRKRPIELTPAGKVFLKEAKQLITKMEEAITKTVDASKGMVGTIRIGYEKGYERSNLWNQLRKFHHSYPNILFTCVREDTDTLASKLLSDDLDVIFGWDSTNLRIREDISSYLAERSQLMAALYRSHSLASCQKLSRKDLSHETILFMSPSKAGTSFGDTHYLKLYEKAGFHPNILLRSNDVESILMMIDAEEGISILPEYTIAKLDNVNNLVFLPMEGEEEYEDIHIMWKKEALQG
ncbi:MAG: LysR family transcriptional regulator [Eubacteriales bacterium]|nr:LysR family transcriptional regulator [Eubacteriales bacterium]